MIRQRKPATGRSPTLLAFGNPALSGEMLERTKTARRDEKLEPLPETEKEVRALQALYGATNSRVYTGAAAREGTAKAEAGNVDVLHMATHGVLNDSSPMYSRIVLSRGEANEDGMLEAWEIMKLDLSAEIVVLSACETARGRVSAGEGLIGLTWAFFVAGTSTTVVSQWKVDAAGTFQLMVEFHRNLRTRFSSPRSQMTRAEALRAAALKMLRSEQYKHPFYWAGFVVVGDGF
jgi:CHAT domain-containing protein